jgi:hypothetical protein
MAFWPDELFPRLVPGHGPEIPQTTAKLHRPESAKIPPRITAVTPKKSATAMRGEARFECSVFSFIHGCALSVRSNFAAISHKNRYGGTESNFVAILQFSVSNGNAINLCPVC